MYLMRYINTIYVSIYVKLHSCSVIVHIIHINRMITEETISYAHSSTQLLIATAHSRTHRWSVGSNSVK